MNFAQVAKRTFLFITVNILVMVTLFLILAVLDRYFHLRERFGSYYSTLLLFCIVFGMGGALVSLALSRFMAKMSMGVRVIDPNTSSPDARQLVETVYRLARTAGLTTMPEVGYYESAEINAFATGPSRSRALVAVSTGLLNNMSASDMEGVLGHEMAHIVNGDMVTMTLIQGVINALAMFLAYVAALALTQGSRRNDDERNSPFLDWILTNILVSVFQMFFMILGSIVVRWFSRWREYRADAGGARYAGRERMISALKTLQRVHEQGADMVGQQQPAFQALKISGRSEGVLALLFADHPPLEERIARLESGRY